MIELGLQNIGIVLGKRCEFFKIENEINPQKFLDWRSEFPNCIKVYVGIKTYKLQALNGLWDDYYDSY